MATDGWGDVFFEVFFCFVLGEFLQLHNAIPAHRPAFGGDKFIAIHAGFEGAFFSVENGRPWVFRIWRTAPGAMGPDEVQISITESSALGVADVGPAGFVHENTSLAGNGGRPAEIQHPADHVQHVDTHITDNAIAVFHKGAP